MEIGHLMMKNAAKPKKTKRKPVKTVVLLVILAAVVAGLAFGGYQAYVYYDEATMLARQAEDLKKEIKLLVTHVENVGGVLFRNHKRVPFCQRADVQKGEELFVFRNLVAGDLPFDDSGENGFHGALIFW